MSNYNIMTMDQAQTEVQRINHRKSSAPMSSIELEAERLDDSLSLRAKVDGQQMRLSGDAESSILRTLGISRKFLDNAADDPEVVNAAIREARIGASRKNNTLVEMSLSGDGQIDMFSLIQGRKIPTSLNLGEVWRVISESGLFSGVTEVSHYGKGHYNLRLLTSHTVNPKREVGDIVMTGVNVAVNGWVKVNPLHYRLACLNGMQSVEEGHLMEIEEGDLFESLRTILGKCAEQSLTFGQAFVDTDSVIVPNPTEYVMRAVKIAGGSNDLRGSVSDLLKEEAPDNTLYQILNIVTALARQSSDNPRKRDKVERVAGRILAMQGGSSRCNTCNSSL